MSLRLFSSSSARAKNLVFLGAPGVGKGTFASRVVKALQVPAISTGDMVRAEIRGNTELGAKIKDFNDKGMLVPGLAASHFCHPSFMDILSLTFLSAHIFTIKKCSN